MKILSQFKRLFQSQPQAKLSPAQLRTKLDGARARASRAKEDVANLEASEGPWQRQPSDALRSGKAELKDANRAVRALTKQLQRTEAAEVKASAGRSHDSFETRQAAPRKAAAPALPAAPTPPTAGLHGARNRPMLPTIREEE